MLAGVLLVLAGLTASQVSACTTAHVLMTNSALEGDIVSVQVWDNEVRVCNDGKTKYLASSDTVYEFDCGNGRRVHVSNNSKKLTYFNDPAGYVADLGVIDSQGPSTYACGGTESRQIQCSDYETVFSDNYGDCPGKAVPQLCDYRSYCPDGQGGGPGGRQEKRSVIFTA